MKLPFAPKYITPVIYCIICWVTVLIDYILPNKYELSNHGIDPRNPPGLIGIFFAPFLHNGILNVLTSTAGILVFGCLLLRRSVFDFALVTALSLPLAGLVFWIIGTSEVVGAGGVICAWFAYLVSIPVFERPIKFVDLGIALAAAVVYCVILFFLPGNNLAGWLYNLSGLLSGGVISILQHKLFPHTFDHLRNKQSTEETQNLLANPDPESAEPLPTPTTSYTTSSKPVGNPFESK